MMDILQIMEQFGIPVAVAMAFVFFIWRQNKFIQNTLMQELDQDFKRLEGIIINLIHQQKLIQMEIKRMKGSYDAIIDIMAGLSGYGLKHKFLRKKERGGNE